MTKRIIFGLVLATGSLFASAPSADAAIFVRRFAPVRRVAARTVLPPYPIARRAVVGPVLSGPVLGGPVLGGPVLGYPVTYGTPVFYGPGVMVGYGF